MQECYSCKPGAVVLHTKNLVTISSLAGHKQNNSLIWIFLFALLSTCISCFLYKLYLSDVSIISGETL